MSETPNHGYNVPGEGEQDWHEPLNENFTQYDTDIELRDASANRGDYEPKAGSKFLATDTGVVSVGDGDEWLASFQVGRYTPPTDTDGTGSVAFGAADNDTEDAEGATIGGGAGNEASADGTTVGGGTGNEASVEGATVGGGESNRANRSETTIGGGSLNRASSPRATVGGGYNNRAGGDAATVPGGRQNQASGDYTFAAGRQAKALHAGSFVWNNDEDQFRSSDENQFLVNAVGGVGIGTDPDAPLHVGSTDDPAFEGDLKIGSSDYRFFVDVRQDGDDAGKVTLRARGTDSDDTHNLYLGAGDDDAIRITTTSDGSSGIHPIDNERVPLGWVGRRFVSIDVVNVYADDLYENSDARLKANVAPIEDGLSAVTSLRPVSYEWRDDERTDTQLGLIAQEVRDVCPEAVAEPRDDAGDEPLAVSYTSLVPVVIDAIQRQQNGIEDRDERIDDLEGAVDEKDERIDDLEARLSVLESEVRADGGS